MNLFGYHFGYQNLLDIKILYEFCIFLDKLLSRFHLIAHQDVKCNVHLGLILIVDGNSEKDSLLRIHGGIP